MFKGPVWKTPGSSPPPSEGRRRRSPLRTQSGRPPAAILRATPRSPRLNLQPMSEEAPPRSGHRIAIARHRARPPPPSSADETAPRSRPRRPPGPAAPAGKEPRERWVPGGRGVGEDEVGAVPSSAGPPQGVAVRSGKPGPAAAPPSVHVPGGGEGERGARGGGCALGGNAGKPRSSEGGARSGRMVINDLQSPQSGATPYSSHFFIPLFYYYYYFFHFFFLALGISAAWGMPLLP